MEEFEKAWASAQASLLSQAVADNLAHLTDEDFQALTNAVSEEASRRLLNEVE
jgi:hypothetical protein